MILLENTVKLPTISLFFHVFFIGAIKNDKMARIIVQKHNFYNNLIKIFFLN
jgi:hypothetical protein